MEKHQNRAKKTGLAELFLPLLFFVITVGLYIPSTLYLGNIDDFSIDYLHFLPGILPPIACVAALGLLAGALVRRSRRLSNLYIDLLFGVTLGFYVQGNFLNGLLTKLNGTQINWDLRSPLIPASVAAWIACLALPHILRLVAPKVEKLVSQYGSALLSIMQVISLVTLLLTTTRTVSNDAAVTRKDEFTLSAHENTVVFVVDTLDAQWLERYILDDPEYAGGLDGFTYFDNVVSCGAPTILGMRVLFTGNLYDPATPFNEYLAHAYDGSTLFRDIKSAGRSLRLYTPQTYLTGADLENIDNAVRDRHYSIGDLPKFIKDTCKLTAFYGMPYPLKPRFLIYSGDLTGNAVISNDTDEAYALDDPGFYQDFLQAGLSATDPNDAFVLYHFFGAHGPYSMNEEALRVDASETSLEQQIHGCFKIIYEYLDEMRRLGIYDDSTVIITADHGGVALYQNPAVLIKRKGAGAGFEVNSAPLTFANLRSTLVDGIVDDAGTYGPNMFDVPEDADVGDRPHTFDSILYTNVFSNDAPIKGTYLQFGIGNPARDNSLIAVKGRSNAYALGRTVELCGEGAAPGFITSGFSAIEPHYRWTEGNRAQFSLDIAEPFRNLAFSMNYKTFNGAQRVLLYANGALILDDSLTGGTLGPVPIPGECVKDGQLELKFELPGAVSPAELGVSKDSRKIAISVESFTVSAAD